MDAATALMSIPILHVTRAAVEGSYGSMDYTVLSVAVITLWLILLVELIRHRLDVAAIGRPFFKAVLEGVYRELATLGIVEFVIFLLHKYYENLDVAQEQVFADVHFTLFYTALFNALASALLAFCSCRISNRLWVKTEQLEVDHYVEIREEFERVEAKLYGEKQPDVLPTDPSGSNGSSPDKRATSRREADFEDASDISVPIPAWENEKAELAFDFSCAAISSAFKRLGKFIRYPYLYTKHRDLLIQIRFHELRVHFLQANDLPLSLKVSDYLMRCELQVLIRLVHISTFAWLVLTEGVIVVYFLMGIVVYVTEDLTKVGDAMTAIFISANLFMVVLSLVIFNKMKAIFSTIMTKRLTTEDTSFTTRRGGIITSQQALFWGGNPKFIRAIIQSMQFGFALSLSVLLVFWDDINVPYARVPGYAILLVVICCYLAFVLIISQVLPRYTLCTSLGQMVNQKLLQETLAMSRLEEAKRKQLRLKLAQEDDDYEESYSFGDSDDDNADEDASKSSRSSSVKLGPVEVARKALIGGLSLMGKTRPGSKTFEDIELKQSSDRRDDAQGPPGSLQSSQEQRIRDRKNRRKAMSEGVAFMRSGGRLDNVAGTKLAEQPKHRPRERRRSSSSEDKIKEMRRTPSFETELISELVKTDTKHLRQNLDARAKNDQMKREQRMQQRRNRRKSVSDGVALMRHVMEEEKTEEGTEITLNDSSKLEPTPVIASHMARRDRKRSVSASASIQQMRDTAFFGQDGQTWAGKTDDIRRRPRSRQSSTGAPRLEPLVEGVPTKPDPVKPAEGSQHLAASAEIQTHHEPEGSGQLLHCRGESPIADDKSTMETSTLGDHSDADDIPEIDPEWREHHRTEQKPVRSIPDIGRSYFLSQRYQIISAVFGTMFCLFLVAMRVESLLIATCSMPDSETTWHVSLTPAFWLETAWLSCFIISGIIILVLFRPGQNFTNDERVTCLAAAIDIALSGTCLALLMIAESQRCCDVVDERLLADEGSKGSCSVDSDCCPDYGKRFYGSVGTIEPFTSIITLRVLRFVVAGKVIAFLDKRFGWSELDAAVKAQTDELHPFHPLFNKSSTRKVHSSESLEDARGSVVELWKLALTLYPDIVEKYGEFSGEMLQAMLGVEIMETAKPIPSEVRTSPEKDLVVIASESPGRSRPSHRRSISVDKKYAGLTPEAQSIILAGKLGKSVRSFSAGPNEMSPPSEIKKPTEAGPSATHRLQVSFGDKALGEKAKFELDTVDEVPLEDVLSSFIAPNARLLRSMRRCDRKLPPLLDKWAVVDVVVTKYEIVYFDASGVDNIEDMQRHGYSDEEIGQIEAIRQAIIATKGGKGLRLRDVAVGRKVVGHLELSSVDAIHVERMIPSDQPEVRDELAQYENENDEFVQVEFWKPNGDIQDRFHIPRETRWERIKQDRMMIHSNLGTLFIRFYSDLDDCEGHPQRCTEERESDGPIYKNNAFQWTQTIVRLCGINQLKQKLPHFGDDDSDELRDYLVMVDAGNGMDAPRRHLRKKSLGNMMNVVLHQRRPTLFVLPPAISEEPPELSDPRMRASSLHNEATDHSRRSLHTLRRLSSTGDIPSGSQRISASMLAADQSRKVKDSVPNVAPNAAGPDMV